MKNKNFHNLWIKNMFFKEARFLNEDLPKKEAKPESGKPIKEPEASKQPPEGKKERRGEILASAQTEGEKLKAGTEAAKERDTLVKQEKLPATPVKLPSEPAMKMEDFMKTELRAEEIALNRWRINIARENYQVNWQKWDHSTVEGVQKIYQDCQNLGIINDNKPFYDTMFAVLRNSADKSVNTNLADTRYRNAFSNPLEPTNHDLIAGLTPSGKFPGGEAFLKAFGQLIYLKSLLDLQDKAQKGTAEKQRKANEDPVAAKVTDLVRSNVATFQKAIRERDYATAGMYAVGMYALWKTVGSKIFGGPGEGGEGKKHFDFKKWLLIGAAVYCGNTFLKNAGYDVLKMAGFKTGDADVQGTPMEVLSNILHKSEHSEQMKDLDYGIVLTMGDASLTTLEELYQRSNKNGIQFIHPREFPDLFPDLKNTWLFKMGIGEEGLKDYVGMSNTKLSPKQKEYIRVGQQIYKLALAMRITYDQTLHQHHKKYQDKTYEEALKDPVLKRSKVRHLMEAVYEYAAPGEAGGLFSGKKMQEVKAAINENLEKSGLKGEAFALEGEIQEGTRHYKGTFHGFPVVVVSAPTGFRIYLRNQYGKNYNSAPGPGIAEIPVSGAGVKPAIERVIEKIEARMKELIDKSPILGDKAAILSSLKFVGGQWLCEVTDPAIDDLDIKGGPATVVISPDEDGNGIRGENLDRRTRFPMEILPRLVNQKEFHALTIFLAAKRLDAKYDPAKPDKFTLVIGRDKQINVEIAYDKTTKKFRFADPAKEKELFKSGSGFAEELSAALDEDANLKGVIIDIVKKIDNANESYIRHFFKSLPKWFTSMTWANVTRGMQLKDITGSVAKNYTIGLIDAQKALILAKMASSSAGAANLTDIDDLYGKIFVPSVGRLKHIGAKFSEAATKKEQVGDDWDEEEFNSTVFSEIAAVGTKSNDYQGWYAQFVQEIFAGKYGMDDLRKGNSIKARDVVNVFSYYTAVVDDTDIDGADLSVNVDIKDQEKFKNREKAEEKIGRKLTPTDNVTTVAAFAVLRGNTLTADELTAIADLSDLDVLRQKMADYGKKQKYIQAAKYTQYVAGRIHAKYNDGELQSKVKVPVPQDRAFWQIDTLEEWKKNNPPESHEFIDTRDRMKMSKDYVTFDEYLKKTDVEKTQLENDNMVILPRKSRQLVLPSRNSNSREMTLLKKLLGYPTLKDFMDAGKLQEYEERFNKFKKTQLEERFAERMSEALAELRDRYHPKPGSFDTLRKDYMLFPNINKIEETKTSSGDTLTVYYEYNSTSISEEIRHIEDTIGDPNLKKTVTLSDQEREINNAIARIIERTIINNANFDRYFDRQTLGKTMEEIWLDFKNWLLG